MRQSVGPFTGRPGYPRLRVACLWGEKYGVCLAVVLNGDEREVLRLPRSTVVDSASRSGPTLPGTFVFKSLEPSTQVVRPRGSLGMSWYQNWSVPRLIVQYG